MTMQRLVPLLLLAACKSASPSFSAACEATAALDGIVCTVHNAGDGPGRACLTAKVIADERSNARVHVAQRLCTGAIAPGSTATLRPRFRGNLAAVCAPPGATRWSCPISIVESAHGLGENLPAAP
jgi:hypothetical protein